MNFDIKFYIICACLLFASCASQPSATEWPKIRQEDIKFHFVSKNEILKATIYDEQGNPAYLLDVRFNAWKYDDSGYNFSGILDCRLASTDNKTMTYPNLFQNVKMATRDWESDARFTNEELLGLADSPRGRSIVQKCNLRGMAITINISNVTTIDNPDKAINELDFEIQFANDPTAHNAFSFHNEDSTGTRQK